MRSNCKIYGKPAGLVLSLIMLTNTSHAETIILKSSIEPVTVVELFTSHGCSSCPPADAWIRKLVNHEGLWNKIIPMAFHVDYWDFLGWKDRFSSSEYSNRQRDYRRSGRLRAVYTPGFVVAGKEWRGWIYNGEPEISSPDKVGILHARVKPGIEVMARFNPTEQAGTDELKAHVAVLGFDISSKIDGGENSGRNLSENFVVLGSSSVAISEKMEWVVPWPRLKDNDARKTAVVVWLSNGDDPAPIQAVGGWIN